MTFRCLRSTLFPIFAVKNNGMSACNQLTVMYAVQEAVWRQKTKEQKDNAFDKFVKDSKRKKCSDRIQSADGKYSTWNKARTIKTKPGQ